VRRGHAANPSGMRRRGDRVASAVSGMTTQIASRGTSACAVGISSISGLFGVRGSGDRGRLRRGAIRGW
jgi:hypothetical protein